MDKISKILFNNNTVKSHLPDYIQERKKVLHESLINMKTIEEFSSLKGQLKELSILSTYLQEYSNGS